MTNYPIETKVKAATFATLAGTTIVLAILSAISDQNLVASLPDWLVAPAGALLSAAITLVSGYRAAHSPRP